MYSRAAPRLYYLRQLRRCCVDTSDLLIYYKSVIRPVVEYCCQAWHTGLTKQDTDLIEQIQRRALNVIYPDKSYLEALSHASLTTLSDRRESLCQSFFMNVCQENHRLNYLLSKRKMHSHDLRHKQYYEIDIPHTNRYQNSFIMHGLVNFT